MRHKLTFAMLMSLAGVSPAALALGLGQATVQSPLHSPLQASVPLRDVDSEQAERLEVRVADSAAFEAAGLTRTPLVASVQASIRRQAGEWVVDLSSRQAVETPWLDLLLYLEGADGKQTREITLLFDPPDYAGMPALVAGSSRNDQQTASPASVETSQEAPRAPSRNTSPRSAEDTAHVSSGDTLWGVANRLRPQGASVRQMMVALFEANPDAFPTGNIDQLRAGSRLNVPSRERVMARSDEAASQAIEAMAQADANQLAAGQPPAEQPADVESADAESADTSSPNAQQGSEASNDTSEPLLSGNLRQMALAAVTDTEQTSQAEPEENKPEENELEENALERSELGESERIQELERRWQESQAMVETLLAERELMREEMQQLRDELRGLRSEFEALSATTRAVAGNAPANDTPFSDEVATADGASAAWWQGGATLLDEHRWQTAAAAIAALLALLLVLRRRRAAEEEEALMAAADEPVITPPPAPAFVGSRSEERVAGQEQPHVAPADEKPSPLFAEAIDEAQVRSHHEALHGLDGEAAEEPGATLYSDPSDIADETQAVPWSTISSEQDPWGLTHASFQPVSAFGVAPLAMAAGAAGAASVSQPLSAAGKNSATDESSAADESDATSDADAASTHFIDYEPPTLSDTSVSREETPMQPAVEFTDTDTDTDTDTARTAASASADVPPGKQSNHGFDFPLKGEWEIEEVAFNPRDLDNAHSRSSSFDKD